MFGLTASPDAVLRGAVLGTIALAWVILVVRLIGLRTFSKMTAFDFVVTLATGSLLAAAATVTSWTALIQALSAIATLLIAQVLLAMSRRKSRRFQLLLENDPIMLMFDGKILMGALAETRVSESDILNKLRGANIKDMSQVQSMVLESTGTSRSSQASTGYRTRSWRKWIAAMVCLRRISVEQYRERRLFSWSNCVAAVSGLVRSWQDPCAETRRGAVPVVVGRIARGYATEWPGDAPATQRQSRGRLRLCRRSPGP